MSETVLSVYENIYSLQKDEAFRGWIFKILSNVCKKKLKVRSRQETFKLQENRDESQSVSHSDYEETIDVQNAWKILAEEERQIIALSVSEGTTAKKSARYLRNKENQ